MSVNILENGKATSASDVKVMILGVPVLGITEVSYTHKKKDDNHYGLGTQPVSYGQGQEEYTGGSVTMSFDEVEQIIKASPDFNIMNIPLSNIVIVFAGAGITSRVHKILNVRFTEDPFTVKGNDTRILVKIPFNYAGIDKSSQ